MRTAIIAAAATVILTGSLFEMPAELRLEQEAEKKPDHMRCLAENIYHEARGEPVLGQVAVGYVTWERAQQSVEQLCRVVWKPYQFSWTSSPVSVNDNEAFALAMKIAKDVVTGRAKNPVPRATHYHASSIKPLWRKSVKQVAKIGNHVFYQPRSKA